MYFFTSSPSFSFYSIYKWMISLAQRQEGIMQHFLGHPLNSQVERTCFVAMVLVSSIFMPHRLKSQFWKRLSTICNQLYLQFLEGLSVVCYHGFWFVLFSCCIDYTCCFQNTNLLFLVTMVFHQFYLCAKQTIAIAIWFFPFQS